MAAIKSIEEKAKAYDEAIEKFDVILNLNTVKESGTIFAEDVRKIFSELAESEDERARKEILDYIIKGSESLYDVQQYGKERFEKWIAWLEKQGEHAKFRDSIQVGDKVTRNQDGMLVNLSQLNRVAKKDEKQGDDKVEPKFKVGDTMRTLQEAKDAFTDGMPVVVSIDEEYYHCNNELIAIKDQDSYEYPPMNRIQKPAEWSDNDEWCLEQINFLIRNSYSVDDKVERLSNWVKSLRDRCTWKPSDAQMIVLNDIIINGHLSNANERILKGLQEQLKRIKD